MLLSLGGLLFASQAGAQEGGLKVKGDFRLRYETNSNLLPDPARLQDNTQNRAVVRFRAGISQNINEYVGFGVRVTTGDPGDPNTADVTLGSFLDDLAISLDLAYLDVHRDGFYAAGGKFANPFQRTDLVWDDDVNPQGATASYTLKRSKKFTPKLSGIYFIIDEFSTREIQDSRMGGGQLAFDLRPNPDLGVKVAGGYYDYDITELGSGAVSGDARSNNIVVIDSSGTTRRYGYVSDFQLLDVVGSVDLKGFGEDYPIRFVGDYVKNLGANVPEDQGFMLDLYVGRASKKHDRRLSYGYAQCYTDAVFAAFSNDNTTIPTNYEQHTVTADYVALENTTLNLTWYYHRILNPSGAESDKWVSRLRLNAVVTF